MIPQLNPIDQNILKSAVKSGAGSPVLDRFHLAFKRDPKTLEISALEAFYNGTNRSRVILRYNIQKNTSETEITPKPENYIPQAYRTNQTTETRSMSKQEKALFKMIIAKKMFNSPQAAQLSSIIKNIG